jgi:hypothetical protein
MKHFFYAVYVLFYTGAVFMAGMFIGQFLERARSARARKSQPSAEAASGPRPGGPLRDPKVSVIRKRE